MTLAHARYGDPQTSHQAAASVKSFSAAHARILAIFHARGDLTDGDLLNLYAQMVDAGDFPPLSVSGIRTRRSELVALGRLVDTNARALTVAGRATIIWGAP